ncbi:MlaD family protein [Mycolicibacter minnesotensis]
MRRPLVTLAVLAATIAGCGVNPVRMQLPEFGTETIDVVIEFGNALNLPTGAKVGFNGSDVGKVRDVRLDGDLVAVTASLDKESPIPADCTAAIVQDTLLGDTYISLTGPPLEGQPAPPLTDGAVIPMSHTSPPSSIEDTLVTLSSFLGGGALQQLQTALRRLHSTLPPTVDETRRLATTLSADLRDMAANSQELDRTVDQLSRVSASLSSKAEYLQDIASEASIDFWGKALGAITSVVDVILSADDLVRNALWLLPVLDSISTAMEQVGVASGPDRYAFADQAIDFTAQTLLPFLADPRLRIGQVVTPDGTDRTADTERVLRNLGGTR